MNGAAAHRAGAWASSAGCRRVRGASETGRAACCWIPSSAPHHGAFPPTATIEITSSTRSAPWRSPPALQSAEPTADSTRQRQNTVRDVHPRIARRSPNLQHIASTLARIKGSAEMSGADYAEVSSSMVLMLPRAAGTVRHRDARGPRSIERRRRSRPAPDRGCMRSRTQRAHAA